ncbi:MAG: hypothetical protein ACJ777_02840, partial [Chloroflexota bacterium]
AVGTVTQRDGEVVLVVTDPAAVALLGDLGSTEEASPTADAAAVAPSDDPQTGGTADLATAGARGREPLVAGLIGLLVAAGLGGGAMARRAIVSRRLSRARIQARIDAIAGTPPPAPDPIDGS